MTWSFATVQYTPSNMDGSIKDVIDIIAADHVGRRIAKAHHKNTQGNDIQYHTVVIDCHHRIR